MRKLWIFAWVDLNDNVTEGKAVVMEGANVGEAYYNLNKKFGFTARWNFIYHEVDPVYMDESELLLEHFKSFVLTLGPSYHAQSSTSKSKLKGTPSERT